VKRPRRAGAAPRSSARAAVRHATPPPPASAPVWKARAVAVLVGLLAVWPLCHRALAAWLGVNPWKLGGFAMYTTATPPLVVDVFGLQGGRVVVLDEASLGTPARAALERFARERHALGELRRPDDLAALVLASRPELAQVAVLVRRYALDPATALMVEERTQHTYDRDGPREGRRTTPGR